MKELVINILEKYGYTLLTIIGGLIALAVIIGLAIPGALAGLSLIYIGAALGLGCALVFIALQTAAVLAFVSLGTSFLSLFASVGLGIGAIAIAVALLAVTIGLGIIPMMYIITNICVIACFSTSLINLTALPMTISVLGVLGLSMIAANIFIDLVVNNFINARTTDVVNVSLMGSIVSFVVIAVPTFFICTACGLPLFTPSLLTANVSFLAALLPTNALNISFLVTATLFKLPFTIGSIIPFAGNDTAAMIYQEGIAKEKISHGGTNTVSGLTFN